MSSPTSHTRRGFLLSLTVPFALSAQVACQQETEAQRVASSFIQAYYVDIKLKEAIPLTHGLAKEKVTRQLQLIGTIPLTAGADKPKVSHRLVSSQSETEETANYTFEINPNVKDVSPRKVWVKVRKENGKWWVTQFSEEGL